MSRSMQVAAAVAAALGVSGVALAAPPSLSAAATTTNVLYIAGSSAAKSGIIGALQNDLCGGIGNALTISSGNTNTNFFAVSCTVASFDWFVDRRPGRDRLLSRRGWLGYRRLAGRYPKVHQPVESG